MEKLSKVTTSSYPVVIAKETHYDGTFYLVKLKRYSKKTVTVKGRGNLIKLLESERGKTTR